MPPPMSKTGADSSTALMISGFEVQAAASTSMKPNVGLLLQRMAIGRSPLTMKTAMRIPQNRNHFLDLSDIVERTSELMIALSMLLMTSNRLKPETMNTYSSNRD